LPVLEESLIQTTREKVRFLDGMAAALDRSADAGLDAWLIAPAQKVLGLDWVLPYLAGAAEDPGSGPVFVDRRVRHLRPFNWWADPSLVQRRIRAFHELAAAVAGHPALTGWVVMDRALEWVRPDPELADLVLKSYLGEIRDRDEAAPTYLGLGWRELLGPDLSSELVAQVDGIKMNGLEDLPEELHVPGHPAGEVLLGAYLGALSQWLFDRPLELVLGWHLINGGIDRGEALEAVPLLSGRGISGIIWPSLVDPEPSLMHHPPWALEPGAGEVSLLDTHLEPKDSAEPLIKEITSVVPEFQSMGFIDISKQEYAEDPGAHFARLWDHFRESVDL